MIYATNIFAVPLILIVWSMDMYLLLLSARVVLSRLSDKRTNKLSSYLMLFTDPPVQAVKQWIEQQALRRTKQWVPWVVVVVTSLVVRHLLVLLIVLLG